ncbi:hypothetical protein OG735_03905 [Streptomyces sp. NBC_01210]|uniref:hypothetical protein n=1 Tax=Streptomyces sp. NBC_01210 TaxID=2903774 RepID=UPI002E109E62|nr:hypothetical protein OG735_03905 [Streptomyces sp. NBC_01210]
MPGMPLTEGVTLAEEEADGLAPWSMPGIEEPLEEPQAARVMARAAAPTDAGAGRRTAEREELNITVVFPGGRTTPGGAPM